MIVYDGTRVGDVYVIGPGRPMSDDRVSTTALHAWIPTDYVNGYVGTTWTVRDVA
jgi:hypothetical protein